MPISIVCTCGKQFRVKDDSTGKRVKCPVCGQVHVVRPPDTAPTTQTSGGLTAASPPFVVSPATHPSAAPSLDPTPARSSRRWWVMAAFAAMLIVGISGGLFAGVVFFASTKPIQSIVQATTPQPGVPPDLPPVLPETSAPSVEDPQVKLLRPAKVYFDQGMAAHDDTKYDAAIRAFTEAIRLVPDFAAAFGWRGVCYYRKGDYRTARADLDQAIYLNPKDALAYRFRGEVQLAEGFTGAAIYDFDQALKLKPDDVPTLFQRAQARFTDKNYYYASEDYTRILQQEPGSAAAYAGRARTYFLYAVGVSPFSEMFLTNFDKVVADCNEALKLQSTDLNLVELRCQAHYWKHDLNAALTDADAVLQRRPTSNPAHSIKGRVYLDKKDYKQAVASLDEAIKLEPKDMVSTRARGLAYFHVGDFTKALPDLTAAIDASGGLSITTDDDALLCRGMIHHANRNYQAAIADFTVVI
ncbi:MAG: tetratricopeptide repeat protein, partial [Planctomycetia bacterium]|nr:tetratricopeptide repeat protein [Planctomycetia bacterium]